MVKRLRLAFVLGACVMMYPSLGAQVIEQVLVNVNGDIVTLSEFEDRQVAMLRERRELARVPPNSPEFLRAVAEMTPQLILGVIDELLWVQRAHEHGWTLTPERITEIIGNIRKQNKLEDEATFKRTLQAEGLTEEKLRRDIERSALVQRAQEVEVFEKIDVTEEEIRGYYESNRPQFTKAAEVTLREILIAVPTTEKGFSVGQADQAKALADATRKRVLNGESFVDLVAAVSASSTKATGGVIGPIKIEELDPSLQKLFLSMSVGDVAEPFLTQRGYTIFKLESRTQPAPLPLEEVRGDISRQLAEKKSQGELVKYVEQLRAQAKITWRHDELRKAYDQPLAQRLERAGLSALVPPSAKG